MIHFSEEQWKEVEKNYTAWWNGELDRPIVKVTVNKAYAPSRPQPETPLLSMLNCDDFRYTPEEIIDALDYELEQKEFLGDAFPFVNLHIFGPGIVAGFCGAEMDKTTGDIWFALKEPVEIADLTVKYDPENKWAKRIKDIVKAGYERWGDNVMFGMPDLGGIQDILASFIGSEELIFAIMDEPEEVERVQGEIYQAFMDAYEDIGAAMKGNRGFSYWNGLFSKTPSYILQDDFAFMVSPAMYEEFGYPDIEKQIAHFNNTVYHLDGVGNLNHLDLLLSNPKLGAIQWVYGAGQPTARHWLEVYDKIHAAGKKMELVGDLDEFKLLYDRYGSDLFYHILVDDETGSTAAAADLKDCLQEYGLVPYEKKEEVLEILKMISK